MSQTHLSEHKLKKTPARIAILEFLHTQDAPVDAQSLIDYLSQKSIETDPATVFRILNIFTEKNITRRIELKEGKFRYELTERPEHHHFICDNCGSIEDISDCSIKALQTEIERKKGILIKSHSLEFFGYCKKCSALIVE